MKNLIKDPTEMLRLDLRWDQYQEYYTSLIDFCRGKYPGLNKSLYEGEYLEIHHILPRCMNGTDDCENLVLMDYRCHVLAHCLLFLMNQDNIRLAHAARCMLVIPTRAGINRSIEINDILDYSCKIRNIVCELNKKPIVCLDIDLNIIRVYDGTLEINSDGFNAKTIAKVIKRGSLHYGYYWKTLSEVEIAFPEKLEEYYKLSDVGLLPKLQNKNEEWVESQLQRHLKNKYLDRGKWVIGYDEHEYCIFSKISNAVDLGFTASSISMVLSDNYSKRTENFGYQWILCEDPRSEEIILTRNKVDIIHPKQVLRDIICFDASKNKIIRIYRTQRETIKDGFDHTRVCEALKKKSRYLGYLWFYKSDWTDEQLIEEYESSDILPELNPINIFSPKKVVQCDMDGNIINIFDNLHRAGPEFDYRGLSKTINRENRLYRGYLWYTYQEILDNNKDKLETYEERYKSNC